jgi:hypothetical protein
MSESCLNRRGGQRLRSDGPSVVYPIRLTRVEIGRLKQAARMNFMTPTDFVRSAALLAVEDAIGDDALAEKPGRKF